MAKKVKEFVLSSTIVAMLLFSAFGTITVHADDGSGTEAASAEKTGTAGDGGQPTDGSVSTDLATGDAPKPTDGAIPTEETAPATEPILEQVPENTKVTVLNPEGEALPLVSQKAAEVIASDFDPIWCPAGQAPTPGANNCTTYYDTFDELLTFLQASEGDVVYQQAGTIYIQQGQYLGGESSVDFNNYSFSTLNNYNLTLQGGWDITDNSVDPADTTDIDIPILIGSSLNPWVGSLTINNINISGVSDQAGLTLYTQGDIVLSNVEITDSQSGADLNAGDEVSVSDSDFNNNEEGGATITAVGNVTVNNSHFDNNGSSTTDGYGLNAQSDGDITLTQVSANNNDLFGANLTGVVIDVANSSFSDNDSGLQVVSTGNVTLASVTANDNQQFGADLATTGAVTVSDSFFNGNQGYGIQIVTDIEVSLVNVEAEENHLFGAHIEGSDVAIDIGRFSNNSSGSGLDLTGRGLEIISEFTVALLEVTANNNQLFGADIVAGDQVAIERSTFNGQIAYESTGKNASAVGGYGLRVVTIGDIDLEDVTADNNLLYGAYLQGGDTTIVGNVGRNSFSGNGSGRLIEQPGNPLGYGLQIVSTGEVSLANINNADSEANQLFGLDITAVGTVDILDAFFSGHQTVVLDPAGPTFVGYGFRVVTTQAGNPAGLPPADIIINQVVANFNNLWGCDVTGNNVIIADTQCSNNVSDSNVFIDDTGLLVHASGFVDLFNVDASNNRLIGADITAAGPVFIAESTFNNNQGFTCPNNRCSAKDDNMVLHGYGLQVTTPDLILVSTTEASDNNLFGAQLNGAVVTITDSTFNNNSLGDGLTVTATDNVTLTNVTAVNNGGDGADVTGVCGKVVQVIGGTFTDNDLYGIKVINATLNLDGTQVFANNGSGNVFTDTGACALIIPAPIG